MTAAYTTFANGGVRLSPSCQFGTQCPGRRGNEFRTEKKQVLDPRVAYITTNMMESVITTGWDIRRSDCGFYITSCRGKRAVRIRLVRRIHVEPPVHRWVGYDDYSDIRLEWSPNSGADLDRVHEKGGRVAAVFRRQGFRPARGMVDVRLDQGHEPLATPSCPDTYTMLLSRDASLTILAIRAEWCKILSGFLEAIPKRRFHSE